MAGSDGRSQFTFYESFYRAIGRIKKKADKADAYFAISKYALYGEMPDLETLPKSVVRAFLECKDLLDHDRRQAAEGRHCMEYKQWRTAVFERDNYTCQTCGARGVKVNAHHKKPYAYFPELRYELENGITLCVPCHMAVHRRRYHGD